MGVRRVILAISAIAASLSLAGAAAADDAPKKHDCFYVTQFQDWKAPDPQTIYLRVNLHDYYRIDLNDSTPRLMVPFMHLVLKVHGSDMICSPLDLDLRLADDRLGFPEPLFPKSLLRMTPEEVAAIPAKYRP
jgi:hypothetical protein